MTSVHAHAAPGDPRFFGRAGPFSLAEIAGAAHGAVLHKPARAQGRLVGVAPLQLAGPDQVSFLDNRKYLPALQTSAAGVVILHPDMLTRLPPGSAALVTEEPYVAWAQVAALFHPVRPARPGVHPSAFVDPAARVDPSAEIGPMGIVLADAEVGAGCRIGPGALIGEGVVLGADCRIGAGAGVTHALLGSRVYVYPGARVGQEGFGFATTAAGMLSVPQLGRVVLEDDVEVGANSTIDRGSAQDTVIGAGSRLDNLVMIAHNVRLGRCCVVVSQAGISGSTTLEDFVVVAAQAGLTGHLRVGQAARIGAQAGIMSDVEAGAAVVGSPAMPVREFFRNVAFLRRAARAKPRGSGVQQDEPGAKDAG